MRKDVKIGLALSLGVVVIAGWYYTSGSNKNKTIPLAQGPQPSPAAVTQQPPSATSRPAPVAVRPTPRPVVNPSATTSPQVAQRPAPTTAPVTPPVSTTVRPPPASTTRDVASTTTTTPPAQTPPRAASGVIDADEIVGPPSTATSSTGTTSPGWSTVQPPVDSTGVARTSPTSPTVVRPNPIPATPPADPVAESYTVKTGDSFAAISETYYGTQRYAEFLMQANPQVTRANALRPGMVLKIPAKPQSQSATVAAATKPAEKPATPQVASDGTKLYVVVANDTFYGIAERELGSASRWKEIYELNKERVGNDPKSLYPGMKLRMPETVRRVPAPQAASASSPAVPAKPVGLTATTPVPNSQ